MFPVWKRMWPEEENKEIEDKSKLRSYICITTWSKISWIYLGFET